MVDNPNIGIPTGDSKPERKNKKKDFKSIFKFCKSVHSKWNKKFSSNKPAKSDPQQPKVEPVINKTVVADDDGRNVEEIFEHQKGTNALNGRVQSFKFSNNGDGIGQTFPFAHYISKSTNGRCPGTMFRTSSQRPTAKTRFGSFDVNGIPPSLTRHMSRKNSSNTSNPIMFSNSNGVVKPPTVEQTLECTLEELCFGCQKRINITRDVITNDGQIIQEDEMLTVKVKPGWKTGTEITFEGMGNEIPGSYPADITFVIAEKQHGLFSRVGDDLELTIEIPLVKALTGCDISIPLLDGDNMSLTIDDVIYPGYETIIKGQGMPSTSTEEQGGTRGNLKVIFLVEFPKDLTDKQRSYIHGILEDSS